MAYTATAYTDLATVKRVLRVSNNKIRIGDEPNDTMTTDDTNAYILDASRVIDGTIRQSVKSTMIPLTGDYPEIQFAAPRITAYLIFKDLYQISRIENLPSGPRGWIAEAKEFLKQFIKNIDEGEYSELSPSTGAPSWVTAEKFFQNEIGVESVHDLVPNVDNTDPITDDNLGPYEDS
jgi:hypothetical protein